MVNKIHFGKRISVLRRKANLTQADLAEKIGVTSQAVSKWECEIPLVKDMGCFKFSSLYFLHREDVNC